MNKWLVILCMLGVAVLARAEDPPAYPPQLETDMLPAGAGADLLTPTNAIAVVFYAVNAGQLAGVLPDGTEIEDSEDLLPLMVQSLLIRTPAGDTVFLDGQGVSAVQIHAGGYGFLDAEGHPVGTITGWNELIKRVDWSSVTNLPPPQALLAEQIGAGLIAPEHLGFDTQAAGGEEGAIQFNADGRLAGNEYLFVDPATGRLATQGRGRNIMRAYRNDQEIADELIYAVRHHQQTAELSLFDQGEETIRLRGDGSGQFAGTLRVGQLETDALVVGPSQGTAGWYIPESGDLSMGSFTTP